MRTQCLRPCEDLRFSFRYAGVALWVAFYLELADRGVPEPITITFCDVMSAMALGALPGDVLPR